MLPSHVRALLRGVLAASVVGACGGLAPIELAPAVGADAGADGQDDAPVDGAPGAPGAPDAPDVDAGPDAAACASHYTNIEAPPSAGAWPTALVDVAHGKLLVVTEESQYRMPALLRCNLDGSACVHKYLSAGEGPNSGLFPSAAIDVANQKLLVVTQHGLYPGGQPGLFRCDLDGFNCLYSDISAGQGAESGADPSVAVDAANAKLLVVTTNYANGRKPGLFRCDLDGSACTHTDISGGYSGWTSGSTALVDTANGKLLVVNDRGLFRCDLDGSACTQTDIPVRAGGYRNRSAVIDASNAKLLVVSGNGTNPGKPELVRCNLDGSACAVLDISAGQGPGSRVVPSAVIDAVNGHLLVATPYTPPVLVDGGPIPPPRQALFRCALDGTGCTYADLSTGRGPGDGDAPSAVLDTLNTKLLIVTRYDTLYTLCP